MMFMMAGIHHERGDTDTALDYYKITGEIYHNENRYACLAKTLHQTGLIHIERGDHATAMTHLQQALTLFQIEHDTQSRQQILNHLATLAERQNEPEQALSFYEQELALYKNRQQFSEQARILQQMATVCGTVRGVEAGLDCYQQALTLYDRLDDTDNYLSAGRDVCTYLTACARDGQPDEQHRALDTLDTWQTRFKDADYQDGLAHLPHEPEVERQVLHGGELEAQRLVGQDEVAEVRPRERPRGVAEQPAAAIRFSHHPENILDTNRACPQYT